MTDQIAALARLLGELALQKRAVIATGESCTAGGIAFAVTEVSGSSAWFDRGFVTYTNESKQEMIDVCETTLRAYGAVSVQTAGEMAEGVMKHSRATHAVAVTGIAGPTGGVPGKPVGTVCFGFATRTDDGIDVQTETMWFDGDRSLVRQSTVAHALRRLCELLAN
jgi:nicotinamide-nucleotide amidase